MTRHDARRDAEQRDAGAGAVEYVGVIVLVVLVVAGALAAVRASGVGTTLAERVTCAVRSIGTQAGDCGGDDAPTRYGDDADDDGVRAPAPAADGASGGGSGDPADGAGSAEYANAATDRQEADPARVDAALDDVRDALEGGFWGVRGGDLEDARTAVAGLNGREVDALVAAMSDAELEHWVEQMEEGWLFGGWSREERRELWELLASRASKETLDRFAAVTDELQPSFADLGGDGARDDPESVRNVAEYGEVPHQLYVGGVDPADIQQGAIGDCWWMASLGAVAQADPGVIRDAITVNENGSYTVRLYDDGRPVDVTVSPEMVLVDGAPALARSPQYLLDDDRTLGYEVWPMVMEKALALHYGDYAAIEGGWPSVGMETLTGRPSTSHDPGDVSLQRLADTLDDGGAIGVASLTTDGAKKSPYYAADASTRLYANHAYYVQEVDVEAGTVTLVNPWGLRSYAPVTLPYADYLQQFRQVDMNEVR
ncbi:C2 family cysteine protease [Cellulomonas sp. FA1]|uniref:C2 family cysteine protease n=1 Tax=Cellulomonas sp. FA1 TaxID=1346710 RepID=UPI0006267F36|nr:C2 family cysteine protease [Cellulomonas sp. FA1]